MAKPNKDGKTLVQFNVKDAVYSVEGETASVKPLTYMNTFTKDRNISVKNIYGDGELQDSLYSDKSITGAIGTTARDMDFEKDIGLVENIDNGNVAELAVTSAVRVNFGFQTEYKEKGQPAKVKKVWLLNVQITAPNESLTQNQDEITESTYDYNYTGYGVNLKSSDGLSDYVDESGHTKKVFTVSSKPGDANYETFLDSVPKPKVAADV